MFKSITLVAVLSLCAISTTPAVADVKQAPDGPYVAGEVIVRFTAPPTDLMLASAAALLEAPVWVELRHAPHAKGKPGVSHPLSYYRIARVDEGRDVHALAGAVSTLPDVVSADVNRVPEPTGFPDDPMLGDQWSHSKINTETAWATTTGSPSIIVGVIDTGCRLTHEDLVDNLWVNEDDPVNGVDDDNNGFVDDRNGWDFSRDLPDVADVYGHGTHATSIVGARIDNGTGIAGIGNVTVMVSKWWHQSGSDTSVAESVFYAVDNGAHIVNLSLGCLCPLPMSEVAVNYAHANDVLVVCSAGNGGSTTLGYPASYENAMAISAIDINDQHPGFSSYGSHIDVAAPSPNILTCDESGDSAYDPTFRGTSASAPHVAGVAALVLSVDPSLTNDEVRAIINETATDVGEPGFDEFFGNGRVDAGAAVGAVMPACGADVDDSGSVDFNDLLTLLAQWGPCVGCAADLDGNDLIDFADLLLLLANWGPCP